MKRKAPFSALAVSLLALSVPAGPGVSQSRAIPVPEEEGERLPATGRLVVPPLADIPPAEAPAPATEGSHEEEPLSNVPMADPEEPALPPGVPVTDKANEASEKTAPGDGEDAPDASLTAKEAPVMAAPDVEDTEAEAAAAKAAAALLDKPAEKIRLPRRALPTNVPPRLPIEGTDGITATAGTQKDARVLSLTIPAPRGQIVDRNGEPLALSRVVYQMGILFPKFDQPTDAEIVAFANEKAVLAYKKMGLPVVLRPDKVIQHYHNRRWLPLMLSPIISEENKEKIGTLVPDGMIFRTTDESLILRAGYQRHYPKGALAPHIIGYVGRKRSLPSGIIENGEEIFEEVSGKDGLEKTFDSQLRGEPGVVHLLYDKDGNKLKEEIVTKPVAGKNVVTTLDAEFQGYAESALKNNCRSGAFVLIHVKSGDILAMGSWPMFDPNSFIPKVDAKFYDKLLHDPLTPLVARAFRGMYPPASTFKATVALGALDQNVVTKDTRYECPDQLKIANRTFRNWHRGSEGSLTVVGALKRSCNTWFYQLAQKMDATSILNSARALGFGVKTGIPLEAEADGFLPTDEWMLKNKNRVIAPGDKANIAIGQGDVLCTPLQAARAMAGIANGKSIPKARIVLQVQDMNDNIMEPFPADESIPFTFTPASRDTVIKGMVAVVHEGNGTGKNAEIKNAIMAGKTGTAQWVMTEKNKRWLAWFTGFCPAKDPTYAFAVVYEGSNGEGVSGGSNAAPMVRSVMNRVYANEDAHERVLKIGKPPEILLAEATTASAAEEGDEDGELSNTSKRRRGATSSNASNTRRSTTKRSGTVKKPMPAARRPAAPAAAPVPKAVPPKKKPGFFKRIFGGG